MKLFPLKGRGGKSGGGSVRTPQEDPNTLRSRAYASIIDLISEGPIEGFSTVEGITIVDCELLIQPSINSDGSFFYPPYPDFIHESDGVVTKRSSGPALNPIVSQNSAGYPYSPVTGSELDTKGVKCIVTSIDGLGKGAEIFAIVYPNTEAEAQTLGLEHFPQGRVRGIYIRNPGQGYTANSKVSIPAASGQAIFLDDVPLMSPANLASNFKDVEIKFTNGLEDQGVLSGFNDVETSIDLSNSVEVVYNEDWTTHIDQGDFDSLLISFELSEGFYIQDEKTGDIKAVDGENTLVIHVQQRAIKAGESPGDWVPFGALASSGSGSGIYRISGKTMSPYERSIEAPLYHPIPGEKYTWDIRVRRMSKDDKSFPNPSSRHTKFKVSQISGLSTKRLTYPFCAIVGIKINAEQFSRIPVRGYNFKLLRFQVPSNYFPPFSVAEVFSPATGKLVKRYIRKTAEYNRDSLSGQAMFTAAGEQIEQTWDGTFYESWTNNPAWIAYGAVTQERIGMGRTIRAANKWFHYKIARYCDEKIDTGYLNGVFSGKEPRFTCNVYIQSKEEAFKVLTDLASSFAGFYYFSSGTIVPVQDSPNRPVRVSFSPANVEGGFFNYVGTTRKVRHTTAQIQYNDPLSNFKLVPVYLEDPEAIIRYGVQNLEKTAFGCTSRGQARRFGRRLLRNEISNTDTVQFVTGILGTILRPYDVFSVYDPTRSSLPFGGRTLAINFDPDDGKPLVTTDRTIPYNDPSVQGELDGADPRDFSIIFASPSSEIDWDKVTTPDDIEKMIKSQLTPEIQVEAFSTDIEGRTIMKLKDQLSPEVKVGMMWGLRHSKVSPQYFSVLGVEEVEKHKYSVTGIEYHEAIYGEIDFDIPYSEEPINPDLDAWKRPHPPQDLQLKWVAKTGQAKPVYILYASWSRPDKGFAKSYRVFISRSSANSQGSPTSTNFQLVTETSATNCEILLDEPDNYFVRVYTVGISGAISSPLEGSIFIGDIFDIVNNEIISGLEILGQANDFKFRTGDVTFDWRVNWSEAMVPSRFETGIVPVLPPSISDYVVRMYDSSYLNLINEFRVTESRFSLTLDLNRSLAGGPYREFELEIRARTFDGKVSKKTHVHILNERPAELEVSAVRIEVTDNEELVFYFPISSNLDFAGYRIWASLSSGFIPDSILIPAGTLAWQGQSNISPPIVILGAASHSVYYVKFAEYDVLAHEILDCNLSSQVVVST
jgi:predicted phage tail protein